MKHINQRRGAAITAVVFAVSMLLSTATAFASGDQGYLALGADLSDSEKATVLDLMDVSNPDDYNVITVTNSEEHKYLDWLPMSLTYLMAYRLAPLDIA